jgi:hypothetical protein
LFAHQRAVAAKRVSIEASNITNYFGSNRIQMNVSHKFLEIHIFLTDDGFKAILKQLPVPAISAIKINRISGQQPSHQLGDPADTAAQQQMHMVFHQHPGIALRLALWQQYSKAFQKISPVLIRPEYDPPFNSADHNVMKHSRCI